MHGSGGNLTAGIRRAYIVAFRSRETIATERELGFTHSHNDARDVLDDVGVAGETRSSTVVPHLHRAAARPPGAVDDVAIVAVELAGRHDRQMEDGQRAGRRQRRTGRAPRQRRRR